MPSREIDAHIDRLYQLPLEEFTAARNTLAKSAGSDGAWIRGLVKPPVAAWAVNQVAWRHRDVYDALVRAASEMRRAHAAVLAGRTGDVRAAGKQHEEQAEAALRAAIGILEADGHPVTDATRQSIVTTLRALPSDEPPGRLTRTLQPGGFEMLAGLTIGGKAGNVKAPVRQMPPPREAPPAKKKGIDAPDTKAIARARDAVAATARALREADQAARREEFERARMARDAEKAERSVEAAREAVEQAQRDLEEAKENAAAAIRAREAAERRTAKAEQALGAARARAEAAEQELAAITGYREKR